MEIHPVSDLTLGRGARCLVLRTVVLGIVSLGFVLRVIPQWTSSVHLMMEHILPSKAHDPEFGGWLKCSSRCFGDKGDVEDITEG